MKRCRVGIPCLAATAFAALATGAVAQDETPPRDLYGHIEVPAPTFDPPTPEVHRVGGVEVFHLRDPALPLVSVYARFRGGPSNFDRRFLAATTAVPQLLRSSGTSGITADSIDAAMEFLAAETTFGGGGQTSFASMNSLRRNLDDVLELWFALLRDPAFDSDRVEVWRGRELEAARRRRDNPGSLAISTFNRLMYGDHPVGWTMGPDDLAPERLASDVLREVHGRIFCRDHLTLGVAGDVDWETVRPLLEVEIGRLPACPEELADPPEVEFRTRPGVYLVRKELPQSTVVIGQPSDVRMDDSPDYFGAQIGNAILGASGFSSRLVSKIRTELGLTYSASSVWTTPRRSRGLLGALSQTGAENTVAATRMIIEVMGELAARPPEPGEVQDAVDRIRNGFVFNFQSAGQIVSRQVAFRTQDLPLDWLERYVEGLGDVTAETVGRVVHDTFDRDRLVILIVGDPSRFGASIEELGPVTEIPVEPGG